MIIAGLIVNSGILKKKLLVLLAVGSVLFLLSCEENPSAPPRDNPLDIHNPETMGDPYRLQMSPTEEGLLLSWKPVSITGTKG